MSPGPSRYLRMSLESKVVGHPCYIACETVTDSGRWFPIREMETRLSCCKLRYFLKIKRLKATKMVDRPDLFTLRVSYFTILAFWDVVE